MSIIPRHLSTALARTISISRIVNVVGPRQDGKSTLVRDLLQSAAYVTLDDETSFRALDQEP
jgi:predicted AAA+ superfamily ATPase